MGLYWMDTAGDLQSATKKFCMLHPCRFKVQTNARKSAKYHCSSCVSTSLYPNVWLDSPGSNEKSTVFFGRCGFQIFQQV